jgi:hypothetical protein
VVGNKIIQITTGLFTNICVEEPLLSRRHKGNRSSVAGGSSAAGQASQIAVGNNNNNSATQPNKSKSQTVSTQAIDIPTNSAGNISNSINSTLINNSMASSNNSSTSASVNNSFSSVSLSSNSNCQTNSVNTPLESTGAALIVDNKALGSKQGGGDANTSIAIAVNNTGKSEQEFFEEAVVAESETNNKQSAEKIHSHLSPAAEMEGVQRKSHHQQSSSKSTSANNDSVGGGGSDFESINRRSRLIKRRYKSGLPLPSERTDDDAIEEAYLKQFCETNFVKQSKDDSGKRQRDVMVLTKYIDKSSSQYIQNLDQILNTKN